MNVLNYNGALVNLPSEEFLPEGIDVKTLPPRSWYKTAHVCDSQGATPACVGFSVANVLEHLLGKRIPKKKQINGIAIWKRAREMFWQGDLSGGLYPKQAVAACIDLGILPPESQYRVIRGWGAINAALAKSPLLQAHHIHSGWNKPSLLSGCLDHTGSPSRSDGWHETVLIGMEVKDGTVFMHSQNSWGSKWGRYGFFTMTIDEYLEGQAETGTIDLPRDWASRSNWAKFT